MEISQKDLAGVFGVNSRTLRRWHDEGLGVARRDSGRTYDLRAAVLWYVEREVHEAGSGSAEFDEVRIEKYREQTRSIALRNAETAGELVPLEMHERRCAEFVDDVNSQLRSLPGRWAPKLATIETVPKMQAALKSLVNELLGTLRDG